MTSIRMSPNQREVISAISDITSKQEYLTSHNGALNVNGSFSITGGATSANQTNGQQLVQIVDAGGEAATVTGGKLDVNATASLAGTALPISGATTAVGVAIVDSSGNQISSFGGGTQYTDGGVPPTHPIGNTIEWNDGTNWQTVSTAKPLPVTASFSPSGTQDINLKQINGNTTSVGNGVAGTGVQRVTIASDNTAFAVNATLSAETTKVIGTVNQGTSPWVVSNGGTFAVQAAQSGTWNINNISGTISLPTGAATTAKQPALGTAGSASTDVITIQGIASMTKLLVTPDSVALPANQSVNVSQINGVTPLMGNGTTGTGSQRVTIASDNTAFSVNATLSAETTKVIGVVRTADGSGNLLTSTANALDINIKSGSIANTSFAATQATASSLNATVVQGTAATLSAGWPTLNGEAADTTGTFTNATQTTSVTAGSLDGYGNVLISINGTYATATAVFEGSDDGGTTWYGISEADRTDSTVIESGYTSLTNTSRAWQISNPGWDSVRVRSTAVGSGTVNVRISPSAAPTSAGASVSIGTALPTGTNVIGHVIADSGSTTAATQATAANLNATVVGTGTFSVQTTSDTPGTGATNLGKAEDAGHTTGDTGVMALGVRNDTLAATTNTTADYTQLSTDQAGIVITAGAPRALKGNPTDTTITSSTAETTVLAAVTSTFLDVYGVTFTNSSATATKITLRDATAGTIRWVGYVPAGDMRGFMLTLDSAIPQAAVNNNWTVTCGTSVASLDVTLFYVKRV